MSNKEERKAPVLRFKGFTDDWELHKLDEIVKFYGGLTYHPENIQEDGTLVLRSSNIHNNQIVLKDTVHVSPEIVNTSNVNVNDIIVVVRNGSRKLIGKHARVLKAMPNTVIGAFMTGIKSQNGKFVNALFDGDIFQREIYKNLGATINQITIKSFKEMEFYIPQNHEKQIIGNLISQIDNLLALQQRKTQLLNKVIKYLTQNLFIQSDSLTPVLRFLSFNKKWTSTKIGKIMDVGSVKRIHQSDWRESGIPFYRARDIIAIRQNKELPSPIYISHEQYENYSETSGKVNMNDLLVTGVGTIGVPLLVKKTPIYFKDGNIIWLKNSNKLNGNFLFYVFQSSKIQDYINSIAGVGTVPTYTIDSAKKTPIVFPEKSEQTDIANLLNTVTNMVHMSKSKKRVLMSIKNYLLQNMFI